MKTKFLEFVFRHHLFIYSSGLFVGSFILYSQSFHFRIGDQFYYATDIESGRAIRIAETGHLILRPLGWLLYTIFQTFGYTGRAVTLLQFESAFLGALGVGGFFFLVYNVVKYKKVALFSALVLAFSHSYWAYSGNGCAYVPCTSIMIFAFILLFKLPKSPQKILHVLSMSLVSALSVLFWMPQVLSLPALAIGIILIAKGLDPRRRFTLAFIYSAGVMFFLIIPFLLVLIFIVGCRDASDMLIVLKSPSQGIPLELNVLNFAKVIFAASNTFVAIPDLGVIVRALFFTGDFSFAGPNFAMKVGKFLAVWTAYFLAISYLIVRWKMIGKRIRITLVILGLWIVPFFSLGTLFLSSDLERLLPAFPAAILVMAITVAHFLDEAALQPLRLIILQTISCVIFAALLIWNFTGFYVPECSVTDDKDWKIAESLSRKVNPNDTVASWGLDMNYVSRFLFYYHPHLKYVEYNLNIDTAIRGHEGWDERLTKRIKMSWANGGRAFIHNRLIIEKDVPESMWSEKLHPHPNRQELLTYFSQYNKTFAWEIEGEIFWEITKNKQTIDGLFVRGLY